MKPHALSQQLGPALARLADLQRRAAMLGTNKPKVLDESLRALQHALDELEIACEDLRRQTIELRATERLANAERARYQQLSELLPDAYLTTDLQGVILDANPAAARMFNTSRRFLIGKPFPLFVNDRRMEFMTWLADLQRDPAPRAWELRMRPRERHWFPARVTVSVMHDPEGRAQELHWIVNDLAARAAAQASGSIRKDGSPLATAN